MGARIGTLGGDGYLVVDINLVGRPFNDEVKLFLAEPKLEYDTSWKSWNESEASCAAKGGHLATVPSSFY